METYKIKQDQEARKAKRMGIVAMLSSRSEEEKES